MSYRWDMTSSLEVVTDCSLVGDVCRDVSSAKPASRSPPWLATGDSRFRSLRRRNREMSLRSGWSEGKSSGASFFCLSLSSCSFFTSATLRKISYIIDKHQQIYRWFDGRRLLSQYFIYDTDGDKWTFIHTNPILSYINKPTINVTMWAIFLSSYFLFYVLHVYNYKLSTNFSEPPWRHKR